MEILEGNILAKYLFGKYTANPKNWNYWISTSSLRDNFFDAVISNANEIWQLKIDSIYKPTPIVLGTKVDVDPVKIEKTIPASIPFGYRKLDEAAVSALFRKLAEDHDDFGKHETFTQSLDTILGSIEPVTPARRSQYACGPFIFSERNPLHSNEYHKFVAEKLALKMRESFRRRYAGYG